jgi:pyruvate, orthophosphate dikinase
MGRPCVVGAGALTISERNKAATVSVDGKTATVKEGDWLSMNGAPGDVYLGQTATKEPDPHSGSFGKFMEMADTSRGNFGVRANADIPRDAKVARAFGAEGIGLCRTEHMFFAEERIAHMPGNAHLRSLIMSHGPTKRAAPAAACQDFDFQE